MRVLIASRQEARRNFDSHPRVGVDTPMQINHAIEVANLLKHNLVQGVRETEKENANWGTFVSSFILFFPGVMVVVADGGIELRIHEDIERGDNDTIKVGGNKVKVDKPCSS